MIHPREEEAYVFSRIVYAARDVVEVKINCTKVVDIDSIIELRLLILSKPKSMVQIQGGGIR